MSGLDEFFKRQRDKNAPAAAETFRALKAEALKRPSPDVVNNSGDVVRDGEVVDVEVPAERPMRLPKAFEDVVDPPVGRPRLVDEVAADDPRRLLPRPQFDPALRQSGFPAYVSPRVRQRRTQQERAMSYLNYGRRGSQAQKVEPLLPHGWRVVPPKS